MTIHLSLSAEEQYSSVPNLHSDSAVWEALGNCSLWYYGVRAGKRLHCDNHQTSGLWWNRCISDFFFFSHLNLKNSMRSLRAANCAIFPNCPLLNRLVCSYPRTIFLTCFLLYYHENVAGKGLSLQAERKDFSFVAPVGAQERVTQTNYC